MLFLIWQESSFYNGRTVLLLPGAIYALCAGHDPFLNELEEYSSSSPLDAAEAFGSRSNVSGDLEAIICFWSFLMDIRKSLLCRI